MRIRPTIGSFNRLASSSLIPMCCFLFLSIFPHKSRASRISAGELFTCAATDQGTPYCWGRNDRGQLGDGGTTDRDRPTLVYGLENVSDVATGVEHACALTNAGAVKCWGSNGTGELGDGTLVDRHTPVDVVGLSSGVIAIAAGFSYTCALLQTQHVRCWGDNFFLELGNGNPSVLSSAVPVDVELAPGVGAVSIAASGGMIGYPPHSCLVTTTGGVQCWGGGDNYSGETGIPPGQSTSAPHDVTNLKSGVRSIAVAGGHTCALMQSGDALCWGDDMLGELGDGMSGIGNYEPTPTLPLNGSAVAIAAGGSPGGPGGAYTCALMSSGATYCWGFMNVLGNQGTGDTTGSLLPRLTEIAATSSLTLSDDHGCAESPLGFACWGYDVFGAVGNGTTGYRTSPQHVQGLGEAAQKIFAGGEHSCALLQAGGASCWGGNYAGQLGDGTKVDRLNPVDVENLPADVSTMALAAGHICATTASGPVLCWGSNSAGNLGDGTGTDSALPVPVAGLGQSVAVAAAGQHSCAVSASGAVSCWGSNTFGELGDGNASGYYSLVPVDVVGLANGGADVTAGDSHSCALLASGSVECWGYNGNGQLGDGTFDPHNEPIDVGPLGAHAIAISAGAQFTCALEVDGNVECWGLGYGAVPSSISGLHGVPTSIAAGDNHVCVVSADGSAECWGENGFGQLGDGTVNASQQPVQVAGALAIAQIDAGNAHTCARTSSDEVYCWGLGDDGQLGDGDYGIWASPQSITWDDRIFSDAFEIASP